MSKMGLIFEIRREIKNVNDRIDKKIVKGESYEREARRHKQLVHQLRKLESEASLSRTFALASFFL